MFESEAPESLSARDFVLRELRDDPELTYPEIKSRAAKIGLNVPPFLYGSARKALDLPVLAMRADPTPGAAASISPQSELPQGGPSAAHFSGEAASGLGRSMAEMGVGSTADIENARADEDLPAAGPDDAAHAGPERVSVPATPRGTAFQFAVETLRLSPDIAFADLKTRASMAGLKLPPIVYGRAKAMLGLVPTRPRRPKTPAVEAPRSLRQVDSAAAYSAVPGPVAASAGLRQLEQLFASIRQLEAENRHMRNALAAALSAAAAALETAED